ncbi:hypothetical protein OBBRIDRAFT_208778 [Obba rivulosa]|uniref:Uncharacterized protein n=1 Tax=Obba rivulosa TaxID=1052685 RepID=A0A8E2DG54_9APHY|nr:hypothetical protein OBBRIDRAFT_208778 [Obba rivulosa]
MSKSEKSTADNQTAFGSVDHSAGMRREDDQGSSTATSQVQVTQNDYHVDTSSSPSKLAKRDKSTGVATATSVSQISMQGDFPNSRPSMFNITNSHDNIDVMNTVASSSRDSLPPVPETRTKKTSMTGLLRPKRTVSSLPPDDAAANPPTEPKSPKRNNPHDITKFQRIAYLRSTFLDSDKGLSKELKEETEQALHAADSLVQWIETLRTDSPSKVQANTSLTSFLKLLSDSSIWNMPSEQKADSVLKWIVDIADQLRRLVGMTQDINSRNALTAFLLGGDVDKLCDEIVEQIQRLEYEGKVIQQMFDEHRHSSRSAAAGKLIFYILFNMVI